LDKQYMTCIPANSIEIGQIPFNLYYPDRGRMVLFCRSGFPVTPRHKELLKASPRIFYVGSDEMAAYFDYAYERLERIISNPEIRVSDKAKVLHGIGRKTVQKLMEEPRSGEALEHSDKVVTSYIDLVLSSREAARYLFALSASDAYTFSHSVNVCTFCLLIGEKMYGQDKAILWELGMSGLLHDVGKTMVDQEILFKPARLSEAEMQEVRKHVLYSHQLIKEHGLPESVQAAGLSHHERMDGTGYPEGLKGSDTHAYAKIAAVSDVYDAITSNRVYKKERPHLFALTEMSTIKDKFESTIFDALLQIVLRSEELIDKFWRSELVQMEEDSPEEEETEPARNTKLT
jgi:HD-GYP domain-containing protein (c-di-GMP phosphodiesterase class II)